MSELDDIIVKYSHFEKDVRVLMDSICARHCSRCHRLCCNHDFCQETVESPFLSHILEKFPPPTSYSAESGWLTDSGCGLLIGRPPVCYEFLCTDILASQKSEFDRYMAKVLSALMTHIGNNAVGGRHLVEILHEDDLQRIVPLRFEKKLKEAQAALGVIAAHLKKEIFEDNSFPILVKLVPYPG